jgi:uroporphyrinogen-III synthase
LKAKNILVAKKGTEKKNKKAVAKKVAVKTKTVTTIAKATKAKDTKPAKLAVKSIAAKKTFAAKKVSTKKVVVAKKIAVAAPKKTKNIENLAVKSKAVKAKVSKGKAVEVQVVTAEPIRVSTAPPTPRNKVKSILVTQPKPEGEKSPYYDLAKKCNIKVDFREFIHVEGISATDFRRDRINILDYSAVIFTSRNAADHYFRMCQEMRITVPETMKYFCISESTAYYLQKYVIFRKRKIFHGKQTFADMMDVIKKHKDDKFLLPCTDIANIEGAELLEKAKIRYAKAVIYKTVCSDLSDLANVNYDVIVFFSPSGVKSLFQNFPDFKQNLTRIAAFGATTAKAVEDADLYVDIKAPNPLAPSMTMALEQYITAVNKGK